MNEPIAYMSEQHVVAVLYTEITGYSNFFVYRRIFSGHGISLKSQQQISEDCVHLVISITTPSNLISFMNCGTQLMRELVLCILQFVEHGGLLAWDLLSTG